MGRDGPGIWMRAAGVLLVEGGWRGPMVGARWDAAVLRMVQAAIEVAAAERGHQAQRQLELLSRRGMRHRW